MSGSVRGRDDGSPLAGHGVVAGQVAEIIVAVEDAPGRRGSGYRVRPGAVLTAAHVIADAAAVRVRFDADLPGEWTASVTSCWIDRRSDLAVLSIAPRDGEPAVAVARFGRIGAGQGAVLAIRMAGFPRFKLKGGDAAGKYRDSHQADGSVAVLSNWREGTLEVTVPAPERDPDPAVSPWEGMSGAAVWAGDRIVGVIAAHHRADGLGRLAAARLDVAVADLGPGRRAELRALLGLPEVLPDVVPPSAIDRVRSAYQAQVRAMIAPEHLAGRDAELDELIRFCAGDQSYAWWQAGPWAGKSALMSWFVLYPPAGVDVVSFFVTARFDGQTTRGACIAALIEQLGALLQEPAAHLLTAGAREGMLLQLLQAAASRSREAGRRLLLVIDGLDEDTGAATGPSIAALLPARPPPGVRVLVASRPHPPLPGDVDDDHPLRTVRPRQLAVSEHARAAQRPAREELRRLLTGAPLQREMLGLITAAGGGLTVDDLAALTGREPAEIEGLLAGAFSRSVGGRTGQLAAGYPRKRVYLFIHETLRVAAEQDYGVSLDDYRDRLHQWAAACRQRGWPAGTAHYLMRGYPQMLAGTADLPRLVTCATDQARHNRMRALTGGDALALTEVSTAQQLILRQPSPDLASLALLAVETDDLTRRNKHIPDELPAVWARIGQADRAEGLASGIPTTMSKRAMALIKLVAAVAATGDHDRAARLADEAEALIGQTAAPQSRIYELAKLAETVAATGDGQARAARLAGEAGTLIGQIADPEVRERALARLTGAVAAGGDHDRAEALAGQISSPQERADALVQLVQAAYTDGDGIRAPRLVSEAETLIGQIADPRWRERPLARLTDAVAAAGNHDRAETLARQITDLPGRAAALARIAALAAGDRARAARLIADAEAIARQDTSPGSLDNPLTAIVSAVAAGGDRDRAARLADQAAALTGSAPGALADLADAVAAAGDHVRAEALIERISAPYDRMRALARLAHAAAIEGDRPRAARLAEAAEAIRRPATPEERAEALARLAHAATSGGDRARATRLIADAAALIGQITEPNRRLWVLHELMVAANATGDYKWTGWVAGEAEAAIRQDRFDISGPWDLAELAQLASAGGDHARAVRLADEVEALLRQDRHAYAPAQVMARLAQVASAEGDAARATRLITEADALIEQMPLPRGRDEALASLAGAVAACGDRQRAEALARQIIDLNIRVARLGGLVTTTAAGGDHARAAQLADEAEALIGQLTSPDPGSRARKLTVRAEALIKLVATVAASGDHARAARLADRAEALTRQITDPEHQVYRLDIVAELAAVVAVNGDRARAARLAGEAQALARHVTTRNLPWSLEGWLIWLTEALAACGEHDRAEELARQITDLGWRADALARLLSAVTEDGDHDRAARLAGEAETLIGHITDLRYRAEPVASLVKAVAVSGDHDRATRMANRAETLIGQITSPESQAMAVTHLAGAVAASGDQDRATRLADKAEALVRQTHFSGRAEPVTRLVAAAVAIGDHDRAARLIAEAAGLARQRTSPEFQARPMAELAAVAATAGDYEAATRLADEAEALIGQITYPSSREESLVQLAEAAVAAGDHDRAEALAGRMTRPREQADTLARLAAAAASAGDHPRAIRLASQAETLSEQVTEPWSRAELLTGLAGAVAAADQDRAVLLAAQAEELIGQIADPESQSAALARLDRTLVTSTNPALTPGRPPGRLPLEIRERQLVAAGLVTGSWANAVVSLARIDPRAATVLTSEVLARWELGTPAASTTTLTMRRPASTTRQTPQLVQGFLRRLHGRG